LPGNWQAFFIVRQTRVVLITTQRKVIRMIDYIEKAKAFAMMAHKARPTRQGKTTSRRMWPLSQTALSLTRW
jgi:hypothetical protein